MEQVIEEKKAPIFLLLDQLSDVRNFGAILRTAECTGVDAVIVQKNGSAPVNAETIKTSAGAAFKIPICKVDHIKDAIYMLQASDIKTVAATEKTETSIYEVALNQPIAIIMMVTMCQYFNGMKVPQDGSLPMMVQLSTAFQKVRLMGQMRILYQLLLHLL